MQLPSRLVLSRLTAVAAAAAAAAAPAAAAASVQVAICSGELCAKYAVAPPGFVKEYNDLGVAGVHVCCSAPAEVQVCN